MKMDPEKKLHITPNDLPWSEDGLVEIRVTGFEEVDVLVDFINIFKRFVNENNESFPSSFHSVGDLLDDFLYYIIFP